VQSGIFSGKELALRGAYGKRAGIGVQKQELLHFIKIISSAGVSRQEYYCHTKFC